MKKNNASLMLLWGLFLLVCCGFATRVAAQTAAQSFEVQFSVPLSIGDDFAYEMLDSAEAAQTNVSQLRPVIIQLLDDMQSGKMPSHPTADGKDSQNDPKTLYSRVVTNFVKRGGSPVCTATMSGSIDLVFTGQIQKGRSVLTLKSIDFTHCPPDNEMVRYALFSAYPDELGAYKVGKKGLVPYLVAQKYESYPISITVNGTRTVIEDMEDAAKIRNKLNKGDLSGY